MDYINSYKTISILLFFIISFALGRLFFFTSSTDDLSVAPPEVVIKPIASQDFSWAKKLQASAQNLLNKNQLASTSLDQREVNQPLNLAQFDLESRFFSALVADFNGRVYLVKNFDKRWPMASLTKLLTATLALENHNPEDRIELGSRAVMVEGGSGDFREGESYLVSDLIKAALIVSSNDAAFALAEKNDLDGFLSLMRAKAGVLNMENTSIFDPTGLSPLNQSTVEDLLKLVSYIYNTHFELFEISRQPSVDLIELTSRRRNYLVNINQFVGRNDFLGGKTGFLDESGGNLISIFKEKIESLPNELPLIERNIVVIVLGAEDRFVATDEIYQLYLRINK